MVGPLTEINITRVSASVSVVIFGPILWEKRPALIRSGSCWSAIENDRTAAFLHAAGPPETLIHSPSRQKLQNPSKDKKPLIPVLQYRKSIPTHRTPEQKLKTAERTGDTSGKGIRSSSTGSESESNKWRGGISVVGELDVNLCCENVIIITKKSSSYLKCCEYQSHVPRCINTVSGPRLLARPVLPGHTLRLCNWLAPIIPLAHFKGHPVFLQLTSFCRGARNIHSTIFPKPALIPTKSRTRD